MKIVRNFVIAVFMGTTIVSLSSCEKKEDQTKNEFGTVTGIVTSDDGQPISDVSVIISGIDEGDISVITDTDGEYTIENVPIKTQSVSFSKTGWLTVSKTISSEKFDKNNIATVNASMLNASAKIMGSIIDAKNNDAPLSGVTISLGSAGTVTSGADGKYVIENLVEDNYTITYTKADYATISKNISKADFIDGVYTLDIQMGRDELLRDLTVDDLLNAEKWYYNEYRGGRNADEYPHWDWACNYMCALDLRGAWQEQNEGTTLQIRNNDDERNNPADLEMFDSYVYGSKMITEDNKILSLRLGTHDADENAPVYFGVQVIDLAEDKPVAVKIGENKTYASLDYTDMDFDLSNYVGKEVIIAIGIYRQATGDYWKQLILRAIRFANKKVENWDWLPGIEVVEGWKLTQETVRSTMPQAKTDFTGLSPISGNRDSYVDAYRSWRDVNHVANEWAFVPLKKDPEVFSPEGYLIKTRNTPDVDTKIPEAYIYSKFAVASGNNNLTLSTRSLGDNYTYFKLTAIQDNGTVTHLAPQSNTAQEASTAEDGCWVFKHNDGSADNPEAYASFAYDLSQFNGENVVIVLGVYNGFANTGENKLVIHNIVFN